jgi:hypothetical protein
MTMLYLQIGTDSSSIINRQTETMLSTLKTRILLL